MTSLVIWILSVSLYCELASAWHMQFSLRDVLKGQCRDVCPRMCKRDPNSLNSDYTCGFACQNVCSSSIKRRRSRRSISTGQHMHMTPLPSKMKFFDIDNDGVVNLFEFARALGHNPRARHVNRAFKAADLDDDEKIDFFEFNNDVWVTDQDIIDDNYEFEINEDVVDTRFDKDSDESDDSSDSSSSSDSTDSDSSDSSDDSKDSDKKKKRRKGGRRRGSKKDKDDKFDIDSRERMDGVEFDGIDMPEAGGDLLGDMDGVDMDGMDMDGMGDMADGMNDMGEKIGDAAENMREAMGDGMEAVNEAVGDGVDGMADTMGDTVDMMKDAGETMADGVEGMVDAAGDAAGGIADAVENIADGMTDDTAVLAAAAASGSGSNFAPPPPISMGDSLIQPISSVGSQGSGSPVMTAGGFDDGLGSISTSNTFGEQNTAGKRTARWSSGNSIANNMLMARMNLSKGQPRANTDSMTTSLVKTRSPDNLGMFRSVSPIRVRVPAFADFRMKNRQ